MPKGVIAAVLVFTSLFIVINGMEMIVAAGITAEKTICVGLAVIGGLAFDVVPAIGSSLPGVLAPLGSSSFVAGTTIALTLNMLLAAPRFGARLIAERTSSSRAAEGSAAADACSRQGIQS
jgi:xanthine/uracil permease